MSSTTFGGPWGHQGTPQDGEKVPSSLPRPRACPQNRSTAYLQWIMAAGALPPPKNAAILAAAESSRHSSLSGWRASAWNPRAMATAYARWILNDASESIVNMQRSASYLRLIFRFCDFLILVLPLYYFLGGCWGSLGPATASERRVTIHCKYAGIGVLASYDFST